MPMRPLSYHAAHRMFERAAQCAGSAATLHALRHTAAYRMAEEVTLPHVLTMPFGEQRDSWRLPGDGRPSRPPLPAPSSQLLE